MSSVTVVRASSELVSASHPELFESEPEGSSLRVERLVSGYNRIYIDLDAETSSA